MTNYIITHKEDTKPIYDYKKDYVIYNVNEYHGLPNMDNLNRIFCEYCGMYYVWKNNLKDDIVVFSHYRRQVDPKYINTKKILNDNSFQVFNKIVYNLSLGNKYNVLYWYTKSLNMPEFIYKDLCKYLDLQNIINHQNLNEICNSIPVKFCNRCIYATTWDNFCGLNEFIYGYIKFIEEKYHINNYQDWINHFNILIIPHYMNTDIKKSNGLSRCFQGINDFLSIYNDDRGILNNNIWRIYAYIIEHLISIYIQSQNFFTEYLYEDFDGTKNKEEA